MGSSSRGKARKGFDNYYREHILIRMNLRSAQIISIIIRPQSGLARC